MSEEANIPELEDYISIKEAASILGLSYKTVYEYVIEGRIPAFRTSDIYLIRREEIEKFKPKISGRPRSTVPLWRISPVDNTLQYTSFYLHVHKGKQQTFRRRLFEIKTKKAHLFPGTIARYVLSSKQTPEQVEIILVWRISVMPDEATRQQELEAFKAALGDAVDWGTARIEDGTVLMHA